MEESTADMDKVTPVITANDEILLDAKKDVADTNRDSRNSKSLILKFKYFFMKLLVVSPKKWINVTSFGRIILINVILEYQDGSTKRCNIYSLFW